MPKIIFTLHKRKKRTNKIGQTRSLAQAIDTKRENKIDMGKQMKPQYFFINVYEMIWKQKEGRLSLKVNSFFKRSTLTWISFSFPLYSLFYCSMFSLIFVFVFGGFLSQIVTDLSKLTVGRLRPSFMAACKANLTGPGCQGYVTRDVCTGDLFEIKLARYETMWLLWSKTRELPCQGPCYKRPLFPGIK